MSATIPDMLAGAEAELDAMTRRMERNRRRATCATCVHFDAYESEPSIGVCVDVVPRPTRCPRCGEPIGGSTLTYEFVSAENSAADCIGYAEEW